MEEVSTTESEIQSGNVRLAVIASFVLGLVVIVAAITMWNKRSQQGEAVEDVSVELESEDPES